MKLHGSFNSRKHRRIKVGIGGRIPFKNKSNVKPLSSAAQMSGVNDDCYVQYYIQHQNISIAWEPFLSTSLLRRWNNGGRTVTAHTGRVEGKTLVSNYHGSVLGLCDVTQTRSWEWFDLKKGILFIEIEKYHWVDFYHYRLVVYAHCQHTFMFK